VKLFTLLHGRLPKILGCLPKSFGKLPNFSATSRAGGREMRQWTAKISDSFAVL